MSLSTCFLVAILIVAAWIDLRNRRIPNALSLGGFIIAVLWHVLSGPDALQALSFSLSGAAVGFSLFLPAYLLGGMGAGDVKLMSAVGAFLGPALALRAALGSLIAGSGVAFVLLFINRRSFKSALKRRFPYGGAILLGTCYVLWMEWLLAGNGRGNLGPG